MKFTILFVVILAVTLLATEAKRRPQKRRRPSLSSIFRRAPRVRKEGQESKRVFYYSLPPTTEKPSRIILGDQLDFTQLGIQQQKGSRPKPLPSITQKQSPNHHQSSLSGIEQSYTSYDDYDTIPVPHPPLPYSHPARRGRYKKRPVKRPRSRGPGYRLERPWNEHYVLEHNYEPQKKRNNYAVMPYLRTAGKSLAGAYRAAILQSAKVAHFTGHAASKYFKGVRNLVIPHDDRKRSDINTLDPQQQQQSQDAIVLKEERPSKANEQEIIEIDLSKNSGEDSPGGVINAPKVYLDWGGSFWRFFYDKRNEIPAKERTDEEVDS